MEFTKIKVTSRDDAKRFYRVIAVRDDIDLETLGYVIGESVHAWFEHAFYFRNKEKHFVPESWVEWDRDYPMEKATLKNIGDKFILSQAEKTIKSSA